MLTISCKVGAGNAGEAGYHEHFFRDPETVLGSCKRESKISLRVQGLSDVLISSQEVEVRVFDKPDV